jgi:hypothetical protein
LTVTEGDLESGEWWRRRRRRRRRKGNDRKE